MTVLSWRAAHDFREMLGSDGIDAPTFGALRHEHHQVIPQRIEFVSAEVLARTVGRDVVPEEHFGPIDVSHPGEDLLIHQQCTDSGVAALHSVPRRSRIRLLDRIRTDARNRCLRGFLIKKFAHRRAAKFRITGVTAQAEPNLAVDIRGRATGDTPLAEQSEVHVHP